MTFEENTRLITRVTRLQASVLDHTGHVARGQSRDDVRIDVSEIQRMRALLGWKPLDMKGRYHRHG